MPPAPQENSPDSNSVPQNEFLSQLYKDTVDKITSVKKSTGKALTKIKSEVSKEVLAKYKALKEAAEEAEKIAAARKAVDWALNQLKSKKYYQQILAKKGITLRSADFYLGLVRKESNFDQQAISNKEGKKDKKGNVSQAKGLFQILIKTDPDGDESCVTIDDVNKFYGLKSEASDVYFQEDEGEEKDKNAHELAAQNNALIGILYWNMCHDHYGEDLKSDWSADDKDKLANMIYNMGPGSVKNLLEGMDEVDEDDENDKAPKNFKEFVLKLAKKLHDEYPADLENKEETIVDTVVGVPYTNYVKAGKDFDLKNKNIEINGASISVAKIFEALKYAELVFNLNHVQPQSQTKAAPAKAPSPAPTPAPAAPAAPSAPAENSSQEYHVISENGKWYWGIAKDIFDKYSLETEAKTLDWSGKTNTDKMKVLMDRIFDYNKSIKNPDFANAGKPEDLKKGVKVYTPPLSYILGSTKAAAKTESVPPAKATPPKTPTKAPEKYEKVGPAHTLKGNILMVTDGLISVPTFFTIDTSGVKEKMEFKQVVSHSADAKSGKKFEHDQIQVNVGKLSGFFQIEKHNNMSYGPFPSEKGGLWGHYAIHLDNTKNVIKIVSIKPVETPSKPAPSPEKQKSKDYLDPDQPLDLSWPDGVPKHIPKKGEAIYIGKDGKKLAEKGQELYQKTAVPEPKYDTPDWLDPEKGTSKYDSHWDEMGEIHGIVFHATEGTQHRDSELFKKQNTHFLVKRNGEIWQVRDPKYETNHTGNFNDNKYNTRAIWDGNKTPYDDKIGIEVETYELGEMIQNGDLSFPVHPDENGKLNIQTGVDAHGDSYTYTTNPPLQRDIDAAWNQAAKGRSYNDDEYAALESLARFLSFKYKIKQKDMLPHSMIGSQHRVVKDKHGKIIDSYHERNRKFDPCNLDYKKLGLPDNYRRIDPDVANGTLRSNIERTEGERKGKYLDLVRVDGEIRYKVVQRGDEYHYQPYGGFGGQNFMYSGLKGAQNICEELGDCKKLVDPSVVKIDPEDYGQINGEITVDSNMTHFEAVKHGVNKECPGEIINSLSLVDVLYYSFDGKVHQGQLVINKKLVSDIQEIFALAYQMKFPISKVIPISADKYNWDDVKSVTDNNSSAFNYRETTNSDSLSDHALGFAFDLNPAINPYIKNGVSIPKDAVYNPNAAGALTADHPIVKKFKDLGWKWGGDFSSVKDYQHFEKVL